MLHIINPIPKELEIFCYKREFYKSRNNKSIPPELEKLAVKQGFCNHEFLGSGSHGEVYRFGNTDFAYKVFSPSAIDKRCFDYVALKELQGIKCVPVLYAYIEEEVMVMERAKGINLDQYIRNNKNLPPNFEELLLNAFLEIGKRKWFLPDLKLFEEVFWDDFTKSIKIVDFGICDYFDHLTDQEAESYSREEFDAAMNQIKEYRDIGLIQFD